MSEKRIKQMSAVQEEALELFRKKNTDYGDAFANYGPIGVIVRMGDKLKEGRCYRDWMELPKCIS